MFIFLPRPLLVALGFLAGWGFGDLVLMLLGWR